MKGVTILAMILIAVIALLVVYVYILPKETKFVGSAVVEEAVKGYVELYLGLINVTIMNESLNNGIWSISLSAKSLDRVVFIDMQMYDSNKTVYKMYESLSLPERPATIIDIPNKIGCSVGDKITVDIYVDPYDPWSQRYDTLIENFTNKFAGSIRPNYRFVPTNSFEAFKEANNTAKYAFRYLECTKELPEFSKLKKCIYEDNVNKERQLTEEEVKSCVSQAGIDLNEAESCANEEALKLMAIDERFAETYLQQATTPSIVIDCKYKTFPLFINRVICYLYPLMKGC